MSIPGFISIEERMKDIISDDLPPEVEQVGSTAKEPISTTPLTTHIFKSVEGNPIFKGTGYDNRYDDLPVIDADWVSSRFMVSDINMEELDIVNRYWSTADNKFVDTTLGGNIAINPRAQFTPYADIRVPGRNNARSEVTVNNRSGNTGMGRYYSEAIDDNMQLVYLEFGIPRFNSLLEFFSKAIDYVDSVVANTGRNPIGYRLGQLVGGYAVLAAFPLITITVWSIKAAFWVIAGRGSFNYYYMDPAMHMYWSTVNNIVTQMATELGILMPEFMDDETTGDKIGRLYKMDQSDIEYIKTLLPNVIRDNNYIDVFTIATRAQTIANEQMLRDRRLYDKGETSIKDFRGYVKDSLSMQVKDQAGSTLVDKVNEKVSFRYWLTKIVGDNGLYGEPVDPKNASATNITDSTVTTDTTEGTRQYAKNADGTYPNRNVTEKNKNYFTQLADAFDSSLREGGAYACFAVDYVGSVSDSFSNSTSEIDTGEKLRSVSKKARDVKFSISGGNIVGETAQQVAGYVKDVAMGALDSVTFGLSNVLQTVMGGAYVDIPKKWDDSSANISEVTYNLQLVSPYGNTISQLQNLYIPIAMLLAGTLPLSAGPASYTSPFLVSSFSKGLQHIKLGMITSLTITRGTTNLGFSRGYRPLAFDVSFTITDFSNVMTAPINSSIFSEFRAILNDDNKFGEYIATLASRDLITTKYAIPKAKLRLSRAVMRFEQAISPSSWGLRVGDSLRNSLGALASFRSININQVN